LSLFPLGALPGNDSGTYLLEEVAIATIAVPQMLPEMLAAAGSEGDAHSADASLLLVGDVDYNAAAGSSSQDSRRRAPKDHEEGGQSLTFSRLKSTGPEIHALRELFSQRFTDGRATALERDQATEDAFRREAPQYRWLLLATHGFFAPPGVSAALHVHDEMSGRPRSGYNCGFMSGLAMAGANLPPQPDGDDGILTAFEVSALDLTNVDLMVLSGCETGLGQLAGGEGTMGLQRA
jgi:CHAT domain-containing protein